MGGHGLQTRVGQELLDPYLWTSGPELLACGWHSTAWRTVGLDRHPPTAHRSAAAGAAGNCAAVAISASARPSPVNLVKHRRHTPGRLKRTSLAHPTAR